MKNGQEYHCKHCNGLLVRVTKVVVGAKVPEEIRAFIREHEEECESNSSKNGEQL